MDLLLGKPNEKLNFTRVKGRLDFVHLKCKIVKDIDRTMASSLAQNPTLPPVSAMHTVRYKIISMLSTLQRILPKIAR